MLKRVALVEGDGAPAHGVLKALKEAGLSSVTLHPTQDLPPGAAAAAPADDRAVGVVPWLAELCQRQESVLGLLADALDCREGLAPGESRRVLAHATLFGEALQLSPSDQSTLERGALLRDLGKMRIPNEVLLKTGPLSYEEWKLLQGHTTLGAEIAGETPALTDIADIMLRHHECYDGDGYPGRLEREAIPHLARIVKIVDVFCAMTRTRLYRQGRASVEEAIEHLRDERGKHFDPELVDVFLREKIPYAVEETAHGRSPG